MARPAWRYLGLGCFLFAVWLLWSGHFETFLVSLGLLSTLLVVAVARRMRVVDAEGAPLGLALRLPAYLPWLAWEVVRANLDVARRIVDPRLPIRPHLIRIEPGQRSDLGRVIHANSITLTPGTVSVYVDETTIKIHALTDEAAEGVRSGVMDRRVSRLERGR